MADRYVLKITPGRFQLFDCMQQVFAHGGEVALMNIECSPRIGETVFLWQNEPNRGLCGVSTVIGEPRPAEQPEWQRTFNGVAYPYDRRASRMLLRVQRVAPVMPMGREIFRSYGGTMQLCDAGLAAQFEAIAVHFETADQAMQQPVTEESYAKAIETANSATATDREVRALARIEQRYWRKRLVSGQQLYSCALCSRSLPGDLT